MTRIGLLLGGAAFLAGLATRAPDQVQLLGLSGVASARALAELDTADPRELGAHVLAFDTSSAGIARGAGSAELVLDGGERWVGTVAGLSSEELQVTLLPGLALRVLVDELASLTFPARIPSEWTGTLAPSAEGDRLYRVQGKALDVIDGAIEEFTAQGVRFDGARLDSRLFPWNEVAALYVEGLGAHAPKGEPVPGVPVRLDLVQGTRLRGSLERIAGGKVRLVVRRGQKLELPCGALRQLFVEDGRAKYLSELAPARAEASRPFGDDLGMTWRPQVDRSVTGRPLSAGGRYWSYGLGVHAPSRLAWRLEPGWKTLRGRIAIDDEVLELDARGAVLFRIHLDGKKVWESSVIRGGEPPAELPAIDVSTARELELEVDVGPDAFLADRADWLDLLLVR